MITVKIDLQDALKGLNILQEGVVSAIGIALHKSAFIVQSHSVEEAPNVTGNLRAKIAVDKIGELTYSVIPKTEYAVWVHDGTRPHYIEGNNYLYWNGASHPVTHVFHPGTKPNPFMLRGLEASREEMIDTFERELNKAVDKFNK